ncbi:MAG: ribulose-phosphate 3-epimerase [Chrysiogenetes bacterium]|nr:ribulose-phosphate 3-epimerase [Chrysiogenetes bacterium]
MARKRLIAPSILSADFARLGDEVRALEAAGADWVHFDVMDGRFVPNITVGPMVLEAVRAVTRLPLDAHLMIVEPEKYVESFAKAGADWITVHAETVTHLDRVLNQIRDAGAKAGVSLNPGTPLSMIEQVLPAADMILLMTVNPGFGGQKYIEYCTDKIRAARALIDQSGREILLEIDGGVKVDNIGRVAGDAVDVVVAGSAVFGAQDYKQAIQALKKG